jgi:hypothetical protein
MRSVTPTAALGLGLMLALGCADAGEKEQAAKEKQTQWSDQQQKALDDPMNYRPDMGRTDVSGGGISDFDRKGFKDDMKAWTLD